MHVNRRTILRGIGAGAVLGVTGLPAFAATGAPRPVGARRTGPGMWGDQGDGTYRNPVLNADFSDPDVLRVGHDYYLVSSEFHFMGMTVLHSTDLVNWRYLGRVYDRLDISPYYDQPRPATDPDTRYAKGSWAPALRYHDGKFWIYFCTPTEGCFMTTAENPAGPWAPLTAVKLYAPGEHPWEDPCPLWDDDGKAYLGHSLKGAGPIIMHRMSPDGTTLLDEGAQVYSGPNAEGTKLYKRNGWYYLIIPQNGFVVGDQWVLRSDSIYGPYASEAGKPVLQIGNGVIGPHQGGLVDTPSGEWWFLHFEENGAIGRVVWLEPCAWTADDWLRMGVDGNGDGIGEPVINYRKPGTGRFSAIDSPASSDDFADLELGLQWEWNHNPDNSSWSLTERPGHLRLRPVGSATDAFLARNTATQKLLGRTGVATTELDISGLADGQNAGLLHISASAQWIGVRKTGTTAQVIARIAGVEFPGPEVEVNTIWLRSPINLDQETTFEYSTDGLHFTQLGGPVTLSFANWKGDKLGLFSFSTTGSGGIADFAWFDYPHDGPNGGAPRTDVAPAYQRPGPDTFTGSYVDAGANPYVQTSELTVSAVITAHTLAEQVPLDKLPATADGRAGGWSITLHADGSLDWIIGGGSPGVAVHVPNAYLPGQPTEVCCTLSVGANGIPTATVYVDGQRRTISYGIDATIMNTTTPLRLGAPSAVNTGARFTGTLANVRIWTRALTGPEITAIRADHTPPKIWAANKTRVAGNGDTRLDPGPAFVADTTPVTVSTTAPPPYFGYPVGTTAITWQAADAAGNPGTTTQLITVVSPER